MKTLSRQLIEDVVEWDVVNWSHALNYWHQHLPTGQNLDCLELGGRRGGPSLWLAVQGHKVLCSDLENPEEIAGKLHRSYTLKHPVRYEAISALEVPYDAAFDAVVFKSIIGGISRAGMNERKQQVIDQCRKALRPGGTLFFAENLESSALHRYARKRFVKWGGEWNYLKYSELSGLFSEFSEVHWKTHGFLGAFGRTEKQRRALGYLDRILSPLIPASKRYIVYGYAVK